MARWGKGGVEVAGCADLDTDRFGPLQDRVLEILSLDKEWLTSEEGKRTLFLSEND